MSSNARAELEALLQRVVQLLRQGASSEAEATAARGRQTFPLASELARLHGIALIQLGRRAEASSALHRAAELAPDNLDVQCNLANMALEDGHPDAAIERLRTALIRAPGHPLVLQALGVAQMVAARYEEARDAFAEALQNAPRHPGLRLNLAEAELELGQYAQALTHVQAALALAPRMDAAHGVHGRVLRALGRTAEAAQAWLDAEQLAPGEPRHAFQAARMLDEAGQPAQAAAAYARTLQLAPHSGPALSRLAYAHRQLADWREQHPLTARLREAVSSGTHGVVPFALLVEPFDRALQRQAAESFARPIDQHMAPLRRQLALGAQRLPPDAPVRVGLLSDAFGAHPVGRAVVGLVEALAPMSGMEVHLFATTPGDGDPVRTRLAAAAALHPVDGLPPAQVARRMHALGIEVLFDLTGYGVRTNTELLALRPAPLQVSWLAYPGTSGAPWIDYLLADSVVVPPDHRADYSEKVLRLARCYLPIDPLRTRTPIPSRADCGLPGQGLVFACFNDTATIDPAWFGRFMQILREVPGSVLWLRSGAQGVDQRLRDAAHEQGVVPERLALLPPLPHAQYLACYALVDLYLDTQPCGAQGTAADALASGCPLLTCAGETFAGRVGMSLLSHLHLPELIATDADDFVAMAVQLGRSRAALAAARAHLARLRTSSPVFDMHGFANDFRRVVQTIGTRQRMGRPPIDLDF